tara:strand:+ start:721 stop:1296 length:576 start_codon:yes stop_codon:yes gene_type:complete
MARIFYGNGYCTVEGNVTGIEIRYTGVIEITKTCGDDCLFIARNNGIIIVSFTGGILNDLFTYTGELKINSVIAADNNAEKISCTIKRVMDYAELLNTNAEDMTSKSEDLKAGHKHKGKPRKTIVFDNIIKNQHTKTHDGNLYLEDGSLYDGYFHVHPSGRAMTGSSHTKNSRQLNIKRINIPMYRKGRRR